MNRTWLLVALIGGLLFGGTLQAQQPNFSGVYVSTTKAQLQLNPDGSLTIRSANGRVSPGRFTVNGDTLTLIDSMGSSYPLTIRGDNLYRDGGLAWIWRGTPTPAQADAGQSPAQDQSGQQAAVSGKYDLENGSAQVIFGSDTSCVMFLPGGKPSNGHYYVNGDTLTINCTNSGYRFSFKIQGDRFVADNGQVWIREGGTPAPSTAEATAVLPVSAQRQYEDLAPPPSPPAPAPTISMGQTKAQVTAAFGEPQRKATAGAKEIFFYTDMKMKVTFTNGKVSSIE